MPFSIDVSSLIARLGIVLNTFPLSIAQSVVAQGENFLYSPSTT